TEAQRELAELARRRYAAGVVSYLEVPDAERNLFAAEQALLTIRRIEAANLIALYVALGGGLGTEYPGRRRPFPSAGLLASRSARVRARGRAPGHGRRGPVDRARGGETVRRAASTLRTRRRHARRARRGHGGRQQTRRTRAVGGDARRLDSRRADAERYVGFPRSRDRGGEHDRARAPPSGRARADGRRAGARARRRARHRDDRLGLGPGRRRARRLPVTAARSPSRASGLSPPSSRTVLAAPAVRPVGAARARAAGRAAP